MQNGPKVRITVCHQRVFRCQCEMLSRGFSEQCFFYLSSCTMSGELRKYFESNTTVTVDAVDKTLLLVVITGCSS